jgi:hypothetical protein
LTVRSGRAIEIVGPMSDGQICALPRKDGAYRAEHILIARRTGPAFIAVSAISWAA